MQMSQQCCVRKSSKDIKIDQLHCLYLFPFSKTVSRAGSTPMNLNALAQCGNEGFEIRWSFSWIK